MEPARCNPRFNPLNKPEELITTIDTIVYKNCDSDSKIYKNDATAFNSRSINIYKQSSNGTLTLLGTGDMSILFTPTHENIVAFYNSYEEQLQESSINIDDICEVSLIRSGKGAGLGLYMFKLLLFLVKKQNKKVICLVPQQGAGCPTEISSCEPMKEYEVNLNEYDTLKLDNPYSTADRKMPRLDCKQANLYLNYGFMKDNRIGELYGFLETCFMYCGVNKLSKIVDGYLKYSKTVAPAASKPSLSKLVNMMRYSNLYTRRNNWARGGKRRSHSRKKSRR